MEQDATGKGMIENKIIGQDSRGQDRTGKDRNRYRIRIGQISKMITCIPGCPSVLLQCHQDSVWMLGSEVPVP
jgi:hypothetical protein